MALACSLGARSTGYGAGFLQHHPPSLPFLPSSRTRHQGSYTAGRTVCKLRLMRYVLPGSNGSSGSSWQRGFKRSKGHMRSPAAPSSVFGPFSSLHVHESGSWRPCRNRTPRGRAEKTIKRIRSQMTHTLIHASQGTIRVRACASADLSPWRDTAWGGSLGVGGHLGDRGYEIWAERVVFGPFGGLATARTATARGAAILKRGGGGGGRAPEVEVLLLEGGAAVLLLQEVQAGRRVLDLGDEVRRLARPNRFGGGGLGGAGPGGAERVKVNVGESRSLPHASCMHQRERK